MLISLNRLIAGCTTSIYYQIVETSAWRCNDKLYNHNPPPDESAGLVVASLVTVFTGVLAGGASSDAPTAISQRCHGSPCLGLSFGLGTLLGVVLVGGTVLAVEGGGTLPGGEFKGAPTGISHRWPGSPCFGLGFAEPAGAAGGGGVVARFTAEATEGAATTPGKGAPSGISHR